MQCSNRLFNTANILLKYRKKYVCVMAKVIRLRYYFDRKLSTISQNHENCETTHGINGFSKESFPLPGTDQNVLAQARKSLLNNKVISIPTDTIYGVTGLAQSTEAVRQIYAIKSRSYTNPIAICVADIENIQQWAHVTVSTDLLRDLLPGPVTLVFERRKDLNSGLNPHTNLVGVRIPDHSFIRALCRSLSGPLALTSANTSGSQSTLSVEEFKNLWDDLDVVVDGGRLGDTEEARQGSTVVHLATPNQFTIIRPGSAKSKTVATLIQHGLSESSSAS